MLVDLILSACLNTKMPNASGKINLNKNIDPYLNAQANWRSNRGDVNGSTLLNVHALII